MKHYTVNEVFYSIQGEGVRAGTANVFVRFSGCNLTCRRDNEAGFDCDTEFVSGRKLDLAGLKAAIFDEWATAFPRVADASPGVPTLEMPKGHLPGVILTGGEPALQVDRELLDFLHRECTGTIAIETNGTHELPDGIDWVCVSPKSAEHTLRVKRANEVKYVRAHGQGIPRPVIEAEHYLISPAFRSVEHLSSPGLVAYEPEPRALAWCIKLVKENPPWRLSVQQHKQWGVR